ncbi:MAG: hypothetical protein N4A33_03430 [Bacteriovoracaceae bacterium]|jgi:isopentenyl-diphosphate delta-isomerase|nr:hypothetical protein [Bacteriovoracaceae bacterium]
MEDRKKDHLDLAKESIVVDKKYELNYEPFLSAHPNESTDLSMNFIDFDFKNPIWISSMTGGEARAKLINTNLAKIVDKYKLGMGLGSCRILLEDESRFSDFDIKEHMQSSPLYSNLGICQLESMLDDSSIDSYINIHNRLNADGIIIHVNPLQEWAQPEGDRLKRSPIESIEKLLSITDIPIAVKEVGQGIGPKSLEKLVNIKIKFIEFGAFGGTNFTYLEHARHSDRASGKTLFSKELSYIGHSASQMIEFINNMDLLKAKCAQFIVSGGVRNSLRGYELISKLNANSVMGFAGVLLDYANEFNKLDEFFHEQIENLKLANCYFKR